MSDESIPRVVAATIPGTRHVPLDADVDALAIEIDPADAKAVRGILAGYDGLCSVHADARDTAALVFVRRDREEVKELLEDLRREGLGVRLLPVGSSGGIDAIDARE